MQTEITSRADIWVLAVALYKTSLSKVEDVNRWDRHAASFASHELEGDNFIIGVADPYAAEFYTSLYSEPLRVALIKAGAQPEVKVIFKVTEKAKEIEEWLMDIGYEEMMVDTTAAIAKDKDEWWNILAGKFIQDMSWGEAELWPSKTFEVIDLRTRIFTDKYVTCQKYMIRYTGGAHEYYKESLHSYDYIHQKKMDWEYLFEEQFRKNVWELLCEAALENEKYKTCFADDNPEDVKMRLEHEMELGLVEDGIVFSYQPYQIGSFADGTFHFIVPYYKLNPYMTDKAKWCLNGI